MRGVSFIVNRRFKMKTVRVFLLGVCEFRSAFTRRYLDKNLTRAYNKGRKWAHCMTLRRFED